MTAKEKLTEIVNMKIWYLGTFEKNYANSIRQRLKKDTLSLDKVHEVLKKLGYEPKQKEIW